MASNEDSPPAEEMAAVEEDTGVVMEGEGDSVSNGTLVKEEPTENGDAVESRPKRKIQRKSFAERSESDSDDDDKIIKKARTSARMATPKAKKDSTPTAKRGRGRPRGRAASAAKPSRGRGKKALVKIEDEESEDFDPEDDDDEEEEDDEPSPPKKTPVRGGGGGRGRGRGRGRGKTKSAKPPIDDDDEEDEDDEEEEDGSDEQTSDPKNFSVRTDQFLIEKSDLRKQENYPIWRLEGPNMLRKYEMSITDGKIKHKSLYAYSSWAESMADQYVKIAVSSLASTDGEHTVAVKEESVPPAPALETLEQYSADSLYDSYMVMMGALFNQAVDSSFLKRIHDAQDPAYMNPIATVDAVIAGHVERIESMVNMKDEFKTRVKNCPNMKSIRRQNWTQNDQATDRVEEKGVRSLLMFGHGYHPFLLTEDKSRGVEVAQELVIGSTLDQFIFSYHGLFHFKFHMMKRCHDKIKYLRATDPGLPSEDLLTKCLSDRAWMLQAFEDLKLLMNYAVNESEPEPMPVPVPVSVPAPPPPQALQAPQAPQAHQAPQAPPQAPPQAHQDQQLHHQQQQQQHQQQQQQQQLQYEQQQQLQQQQLHHQQQQLQHQQLQQLQHQQLHQQHHQPQQPQLQPAQLQPVQLQPPLHPSS